MRYPKDWKIENTGGGCQWLRKGRLAITNGDAGLPQSGSVELITLDANGDCDESMPILHFASLDAALAYVSNAERIYSK